MAIQRNRALISAVAAVKKVLIILPARE